MSEHATDPTSDVVRASSSSERGSALFGTLVLCLGLTGLLYATVVISATDVKEARVTVSDVQAKYLAEAGFERGVEFLLDSINKANSADPLENLGELFDDDASLTPFVGEPILFEGAEQGAYTVTLTREAETSSSMTVRIDATGYLPTAPSLLGNGQRLEDWHAVSVTVVLSLAPSEVFDYAYFINNWGWFYGSTIYANGNVRSNGQFDAAGYEPTVTGQPRYTSVEASGGDVTLSGYEDDNGDGLEDGNDGGIFSGWDIVGAQKVQANGGKPSNQHDFQDPIEMPNLSDLSAYEERAVEKGGSVSIGGLQVADSVYGDGPTERKNLYLIGTAADPVEIDGPVVVQGDVIIGGYVTGQGVIYAEGDIYCPTSVMYVDGPSTPRPTDNTPAATEKWMEDNWDKDFLGLFAAEHIVIGDYTDSKYESYVDGWLASSMNKSEEDAGEDLVPNTIEGWDGKLGTADDDVLEDDGDWTVEYYTKEDKEAGFIPSGKKVGDVVPGSGEDIDGDGEYDGSVRVADLDVMWHLNYGLWGGNMPVSGVHDFSKIGSMNAFQLDAVFYTNHVFAWVVLGSDPAVINGALISRNESIVYGTPSLTFNYDCRLLGGASGLLGDLLPRVIQEPTVVRWTEVDEDPNYYVEVAP